MKCSFKIKIAALLALLLFPLASFASSSENGQGDWQDKIRSEKIAFLTAELDLTPSEAEKFWPEYNAVQNDRNSKMEDLFKAYKALRDASRVQKSEGEYEALLAAYIKAEAETHSHEKEYVERFRKVLPAQKVAKLIIAEEKFRRNQIKRLRRPPTPKHEGDER